MSESSIWIVVLNWNNYQDTKTCLSSLRKQAYSNIHVLLVDNGSIDGSGKRLRREFEETAVLFNEKNLGFSRGCNRGIQYALEQNADYILLLNNDVRLPERTVERLMKTAELRKRALVGGIIYDESGENIWYAGGSLLPEKGTSISWTSIKDCGPYPTEFLPGAFMCIPREFFEEHGLLDEAYFFGQEDREIAFWAKNNNWDLLIDPEVEVYHSVASTAGKENGFRTYHEMYNRIVFARRELSLKKQLLFVLHFTHSAVQKFIMWSIEGRRELTYGLILSIHDGLMDLSPRKPVFFR